MQQLQHFKTSLQGDDEMLKLAITGTTQCVGFARRWLEINRNLTFSDVNKAADIWSTVTHYKRLSDNRLLTTTNYCNGHIKPPQYGDLIIYDSRLCGTGHVAVVTAVNQNNTISVVEQNYMNRFQSPDEQREIPYLETCNGFHLQQQYIVGWKHFNKSKS